MGENACRPLQTSDGHAAHRKERVETFSPKAWAAMSDLCVSVLLFLEHLALNSQGGHDRIKPGGDEWGDSIIANLGKPEYVDEQIPHPKELDRWHCDGDFFLHVRDAVSDPLCADHKFLDSPEQALVGWPIGSESETELKDRSSSFRSSAISSLTPGGP